MSNRIHWYFSAFVGLSIFTYAKLVYYVPDGYVGLLQNKKTNLIENYIMHPGPHIRSSLNEECVLFKNSDNNLYRADVTNVVTGDKRSKNEVAEGTSNVSASLKVLYRLSVKDVANLYRDYGPDEVYPKEVFADVASACVNKVASGLKFADLEKGLKSDEKFLRTEFTNCMSAGTSRRLVTVTWAQITSVERK